MVVIYHLFWVYSQEDLYHGAIKHGYLAVDFFFVLSGFVVAYAYDDRWNRMSQLGFYKRRLIRLQPMVVMGMAVGAALLYLQAGHNFLLIAGIPVWKVLLLFLLGSCLVPLPIHWKIHAHQEMYPLNVPVWSLFYEYLANILYAVVLRRLSTRVIGIVVLLAAAFLVHLAVFGSTGDVDGGWTLAPAAIQLGVARILFSFTAGVLLMRSGLRLHVKGAFWICAALLILALALPRLGGPQSLWINGLYDTVCVIVLFPVIVAMGAGERLTDGISVRLSRFFGDISYPLYVTHYPLVYVYTAWVKDHDVPPARGFLAGTFLFAACLALAYVCLKFYDEPVRRWLTRKFVTRLEKSPTG